MTVLVLLSGAALGACATVDSAEEPERSAEAPAAKPASPVATAAPAPPPAPVWEPWPPPGRADVGRAPATGELIELECPKGGMQAMALLELVSKETGVVVSYDSSPQGKVRNAKLDWTGKLRVPRSRLLDLCRALLSYHALVLVPVGPREATETWMVLDQANAMVKTRPLWIAEEEVFGYGDCDGLYVVTTIRLRDTVDSQRVRTALTPLATTTAGIGRVQDVAGTRHLILGDFAPVVAAMKRLVDEINRLAEPPAPGRPLPPHLAPPAAPKK